jgi:RND family efflux transporter MFP subunit
MSWQVSIMKPAASAPAILLFVAAFAIAGCGDSNKYAAPPPPKVTVATPAERDITSYFDATGNTAAVNSVDLVARVQGFIQEISYTDGDFVKKDTLLFTIEPEPYRLKLLAAQAAEAGAQATLKQAEAEYKRQAELASKQFASQAVLDQAEATRDSGRANLQQAQTNTQQAAINLGYTKVTAPFDGRVSARLVSLGQLVGASSPTVLATIVEEDPIYVDFTVSERDVLEVRANLAEAGKTQADVLGMPVEVALQNETGYPHHGKLDYVAPTINSATGTLAARASLPNANGGLLPGYFVHVRIPYKSEPALLVPDTALGTDQAGRYVLVVNADNVVEQRRVEIGQLVGDLRVIESGLHKEDRAVVGGIMRAIPGRKVEPELRAAAAN